MEIRIYKPEFKEVWDSFVTNSKNGTFLHQRDFIEYHGKRFNDHSLLFYSEDRLIALLPGHISDHIYYSHNGLTYGGLIMSYNTRSAEVLKIFEYLTVTFRHQGIKKIIYKPVPHIYHKYPSEEDLYALFRYKATISARTISSTIELRNRLEYSVQRKRGVKSAIKNNLRIEEETDFSLFWQVLENNLRNKYNANPVHSLDEIMYLKSKFQNNIHLFTAMDSSNQLLGGCLIFEMSNLIHVQYNAATVEGQKCGAIDLLIDHILCTYSHKDYFDYGISTEDNGHYINNKLIHQKEGFGARATIYDTYCIDL